MISDGYSLWGASPYSRGIATTWNSGTCNSGTTTWGASASVRIEPQRTVGMSPNYGRIVLDFLEYTSRNTNDMIKANRDNISCHTIFTNVTTGSVEEVNDEFISNTSFLDIYDLLIVKNFFSVKKEYKEYKEENVLDRLRAEIKDWCGGILNG